MRYLYRSFLALFLWLTLWGPSLHARPLLQNSRHEMNARVIAFDAQQHFRVLQYNRLYRVKLLGVALPAPGSNGALRLQQFLTRHVLGQVVGVRSLRRLKNGVLLAEIMVGGKSLNAQLLAAGLGRAQAGTSSLSVADGASDSVC